MEHEYTDERLKKIVETLVIIARRYDTDSIEDKALLDAARVVRNQMEQPGDVTVTR